MFTGKQKFVVVILDQEAEPCGMGILIDVDTVLTCAHVVNIALGRDATETDQPRDDQQIKLELPFTGHDRRGHVARWRPPGESDNENDLCLLQLTSPVGTAAPAKFADVAPGETFRVCRRTGSQSPLSWGSGRVGDSSNGGYCQVHAVDGAPFLDRGFSGGPVICKRTNRVLGIVARWNSEADTGHIIATQTVRQFCDVASGPDPIDRRLVLGALATSALAATPVAYLALRPPVMRIGIKAFPGYAPLWVAKDLGLFRDVRVEFSNVDTVADTRDGVKWIGGVARLDAGMWLAGTHALFRSDNTPVPAKVVLKLDVSKQGDGILAQKNITRIEDLKGKRVAVQKDDAGEYMLRRLCSLKGFDYGSIVAMNRSAGEAAEGFRSREFAAATTYEPHLSQIVVDGQPVQPKWTATDLLEFGIIDVLAVREDFILKHPDSVKGLIEGWYAAVGLLTKSNGPDPAALKSALRFFDAHKTEMKGDEFLREISPNVIHLADRDANLRFFTKYGEKSVFQHHYDNGLDVFKDKVHEHRGFKEDDIPKLFHPR